MTDDLQNRLQTAMGDGYLIERELGGAGMSRVFAATEQALQRRVVVKVLPPELAAGVNHERFRREIQVAAQLQHPHIVPLLAAGESGGLLWFTMPFIEGESLRAAITRKGRFGARDVVRILHDVTDALAYAHARGVIHRDIKPGNILTSGMHAMVTDFGVAKALSASTAAANGGTTTGMAIGTPAYMAPEQLAADPAADHRMDIYAVGLLGYELLTGKSPFSGTSPQATLAAQLTVTPEAPSRSLPEVPVALSNIIMQCLEKDADKRPPSATALLAELDVLPMIGSGETLSHALNRPRRWPLIAAAAALVLATGVVLSEKGILGGGSSNANTPPRSATGTPSGIGNQPGAVALAATGDSASLRRANGKIDTVFLYRDTNMTDAEKSSALPLVISRRDSVAIADAFRERRAAELPSAPPLGVVPAPKSSKTSGTSLGGDGKALVLQQPQELPPISRDSLYAEVLRVFADSIKLVTKQLQQELARVPGAALRLSNQMMGNSTDFSPPIVAPAPAGITRIVVQPFSSNGSAQSGPPTGNPGTSGASSRRGEIVRLAHAMADSVRTALESHTKVDVVDADLTSKAQANSGASNFVSVGWSLRADYIVTGSVVGRRDSLTVFTQFNDLRGGFNRQLITTVPMSEPFQSLASTVQSLHMWIDSARVQRRPTRGGRGSNGREPDGAGSNRDGVALRVGPMSPEAPRAPKVPPLDERKN